MIIWDKFAYFTTKTYVNGTHQNCLSEAILMNTNNIYFGVEIREKKDPLNTPIILSSGIPFVILSPEPSNTYTRVRKRQQRYQYQHHPEPFLGHFHRQLKEVQNSRSEISYRLNYVNDRDIKRLSCGSFYLCTNNILKDIW